MEEKCMSSTALEAEKATIYISDDTRRNIKSSYNFKTGCVKTVCLHEDWQTGGRFKTGRGGFKLYYSF